MAFFVDWLSLYSLTGRLSLVSTVYAHFLLLVYYPSPVCLLVTGDDDDDEDDDEDDGDVDGDGVNEVDCSWPYFSFSSIRIIKPSNIKTYQKNNNFY